MPAIRNFAFDLDGTLIDTERAVLLAWQDTLAGYGYARDAIAAFVAARS